MTGFTGVNWVARKAKKLALDLTTGAGPTHVVDSALAWQEISAAFAEVHENSLQVGEKLMEGYRGPRAEEALTKLNPFTEWLDKMAGLTQQVSDTANTYAESYGTAVLDMPHINDLAQLEKAKAEALSAGGALFGLHATTEGMEQGLDLQAAKAMDTYESASEPAAKVVEFPPAPEVIKYPEEKSEANSGNTGVSAAGVGLSEMGPSPLSPDSVPGVQSARAAAISMAGNPTAAGGTGYGMGGMGAPMAGMMAGGALAASAGKGIKVGGTVNKKDEDEDDKDLTAIGATGVFMGDESKPVELPDILTSKSGSDKVADFENVDTSTLFERGGSKGAVAPPVLGASAEL
ncbi:PPE domain-containing protein [Mycobacteroides abscessus]